MADSFFKVFFLTLKRFHPSPCQPAHYLLSQVWQVNADEDVVFDVVDSNVVEGFLGQECQRDFEDQSTNYLGDQTSM